MDKRTLESIAEDLYSTLPLIGRTIQKRFMKPVISDMGEDILAFHLQVMRLLRTEGTMHVAEISKRLHIARPQMTHLIDRLVKLSLADRTINRNDRRMYDIRLTPKGEKLIREYDERLIENSAEILSLLTDDEIQELSHSLSSLKSLFVKLRNKLTEEKRPFK